MFRQFAQEGRAAISSATSTNLGHARSSRVGLRSLSGWSGVERADGESHGVLSLENKDRKRVMSIGIGAGRHVLMSYTVYDGVLIGRATTVTRCR